jgi:hypothetical protein
MTPQLLSNQNTIKFDELELGKRTKDSTAVKAPVKLALYILKDPKDVIAFDLAVEGNPSEPQFSYRKLLWKTLGNFFIKTAAAPFNALAGLVNTNPEDLENLQFDYAQNQLDDKQIETLTNIALIMQKKPDLVFSFVQFTNLDEEMEAIAVQRIKKDYVISTIGASADSAQIVKAVNDLESSNSDFVNYVHIRVPQADSLAVGKACAHLFSSTDLNTQLQTLITDRNKHIRDYLINTQGVSAAMLEVTTTDMKNIPDELEFPHFKIEVSIH